MAVHSVSNYPGIMARHPGLEDSVAKAQEHRWEQFPVPVLCAFLGRLERRFPGMTVSELRPLTDCFGNAGEWVAIRFRWTTEAILSAGLLTRDQLPQGVKRLWRSDIEIEAPAVNVTVRRRARAVLEVCLGVPPNATPDDPLAFFRSASVRAADERPRPVLRLVVDNTVGDDRAAAAPVQAFAQPAKRTVEDLLGFPTPLEQQLLEVFRKLTPARQLEVAKDLAYEAFSRVRGPQP